MSDRSNVETDPQFLKDFGRYVRDRRTKAGDTQNELAKAANLDRKTIGKIERLITNSIDKKTVSNILMAICGTTDRKDFENFRTTLNQADRESSFVHKFEKIFEKYKFYLLFLIISPFLVLYLIFGLNNEIDQSETSETEINERPQKTYIEPPSQAAKKDPPELDFLTLSDQIRSTSHAGEIKIYVPGAKNMPYSAILELSRDGKNFQQTSIMNNFRPSDKLILRYTSHEWSGPTKQIDLTKKALEITERHLVDDHSGNAFAKCNTGGCLISSHICNKDWTKLALGRNKNQYKFELNLDNCPKKEPYNQRICLSFPQMFSLTPKEKIYGALFDKNGKRFNLDLIVNAPRNNYSGLNSSIPLKPTGSKNETPYAEAFFHPRIIIEGDFHFRINLFAGVCDSEIRKLDYTIYYDIDGQGFLQGRSDRFGIPIPEKETIDLKIENKDGQFLGPYSYQFDPIKTIQTYINALKKPQDIYCHNYGNNSKKPSIQCLPQGHRIDEFMRWGQVSAIHFGTHKDDLNHLIKLNMNPEAILNRIKNRKFNKYDFKAKSVFFYKAPEGISNIYYQLVYSDGSKTIVKRKQF
ncbi:MAG: hypothetical protein DHS20C07_16090 [Methyloligella sp.]|nr:MAG: hypothetical protein DHS20C07_16090 [Methyloligella sp.]